MSYAGTVDTYLALLRGINVGGKNKVEMPRLTAAAESLGLESVRTYINTGNVIFRAGSSSRDLADSLEGAIQEEFGLRLKVLVRNRGEVRHISNSVPSHWVNDSTMKSDVMFLWDEVDSEDVVEDLTIKPGIDEVIYVPGALLWSVARGDVTRSGMSRLVGTKLYKQMTVRNCNTTRKLAELMNEVDSA